MLDAHPEAVRAGEAGDFGLPLEAALARGAPRDVIDALRAGDGAVWSARGRSELLSPEDRAARG